VRYLNQINTGQVKLGNSSSYGINIIFTGDFCPIGRIEKLCLDNEFKKIYGKTLPFLKDKDLSITNLECPLTEKLSPIKKAGPKLIADPRCVDMLKFGSFDIISLANNHILDQDEAGLRDTLQVCEESGQKTVGAGENMAAAIRPLFVRIKDKRIAILNFTEHEFSIATQNSAGAAPLNPVKNYYQILEAKRNSDIVIIIIHGGNEHYPLPSPRMVETYRFFADLDVTVIIGHHTHCSSGFEIYNSVPIFYSLGNFIFDWKNIKSESWYEGYFIKLTIAENKVTDIALTPYFQCKNDPGLQLMDKEESTEFLGKIEGYSSIIQDSDLLEKKWRSFCEKQKRFYLNTIHGRRSLVRRLAGKLNMLHCLDSKRIHQMRLSVIRCESHREALITLLSKRSS